MSTTARNPSPEEPCDKSLRPVVPPTTPDAAFEEAKAAGRNFSIVVGGPVYDFFLRIGLVRRGLPNVRPRIIAFVAIAWLPPLVLSIKDGLALGEKVTIPLSSRPLNLRPPAARASPAFARRGGYRSGDSFRR